MFDELCESGPSRYKRDPKSLLISGAIHTTILCALLLVPLLAYQEIEARHLTDLLIPSSPPLPAPLPVPPANHAVPEKRQLPVDRVVRLEKAFVIPRMVPDEIPPPEIDALPDLIWTSSAGGAPMGIPGGPVGIPAGVVDRLTAGNSIAPPPPPPTTGVKEPIRVGGSVQAAKLIRRVDPEYPTLARRARVQGVVLLQVYIGEAGQVEKLTIIRGHPLLNESAVTAVQQWKYSPTLLNGEPVPVFATVTVSYVL